jgi:hypothetical protein
MRNAWMVVCVLAACTGKKEEAADKSKPILVRDEEMAPPKQPQIPEAEPAIATDPVPTDPLPNKNDPAPECVDTAAIVSFDPGKLKACFDSNGDEQADRCVTWRRDGKVQKIDTVFAVEDSTAPSTEVKEPVIYRSNDENNDEDRILLDYNHAEICPYDRTCMKIMPKIQDDDGDGELEHVLTDPDYKRAVMVIRQGEKGFFEIWDLATGHQRSRFGMKRLVEDEMYSFNAVMGSGVVIATATADSTMRGLGTIFGVDGGFRGELAQGSRNLDLGYSFTHAGTYGVVDVGSDEADDAPYIVYLHNLSTGASTGKFTIKRTANADLEFHKLKNGFVAATQTGEQLRIDMIDLKSRTDRVLFVPGC